MTVFYTPIASAFGQNVIANAGSKLFFFETGTITPKETFADAAETVSNTDPVIADSRGRFGPIFITGAYDVELTDADEVQTWKVLGLTSSGIAGGVVFLGNFDSSTNAGDYPATGSKGDLFVVTTGFTLNPASGSHILSTRDFIIANIDGATGVDADWDIIRGVDGARLAEVSIQPYDIDRAYQVGEYAIATDFKQYRALLAQTGNDPAGGGDPTNWLPIADLVNDAVTDDSTRGSTAAVAKDLQDQINNPTAATQTSRGANFVRVVGGIASSAADPVNDITFLARTIVFSDKTGSASVAALTKRLDAPFAVGNGAGGLASSLLKLPNTTYHCFALSNPDGSVSDYGFDTSPIATNLLADAAAITAFGAAFKWVRIWSIITDGTAAPNSIILPFTKSGKYCYLKTRILDITDPFVAPNPTDAKVLTFSGPVGIETLLIITILAANNATASVILSSLDSVDLVPSLGLSDLTTSSNNDAANSEISVKTNLAAQIRGRVSIANLNFFRGTLKAWLDFSLTEEN